jgi:phage shock protein A
MRFLELLVLRLVLWVGLPLLLVVFAVGPARFWRACTRAWRWLWEKRLDPQDVLTEIVYQHEQHVSALRQALGQSEAVEQDIARNLRKSEENSAGFEQEAHKKVETGDDLGARAALYKLNLERLASDNFRQQLERQKQHIAESRHRLYLVELQLRQYEVGRNILLSQLAEAKSVEQQYAIAQQFDPFSAVANWQKAEGLVQEKAINARAAEQVYNDTAELPLVGQPAQVDPALLDAQLAEFKQRCAGRDGQG